ncbi:MAG: hypothetical protein V5A64_07155 [Candidatus Thermoplasmatota archaeon]
MNKKTNTKNKASEVSIIEKDGIYYETDFETFKKYNNIMED